MALPLRAAELLRDVEAPPRLVTWAAGRDLLLARGIPPELAKYAATHSAIGAESTLDELVVSLADTVLTDIGDGADERLAYQMSYPLVGVVVGVVASPLSRR